MTLEEERGNYEHKPLVTDGRQCVPRGDPELCSFDFFFFTSLVKRLLTLKLAGRLSLDLFLP